MVEEDKLNSHGLESVWSKIVQYFFTYAGGTIYKDGESYPLSIRGGGTTSALAGINFYAKNGTTLLGRLRMTSAKIQYNNGTHNYDIWHEGNANLDSVDWTCRDLIAARDVIATRGVSAHGYADISTSEASLAGAVTAIMITGDAGGPYSPSNGLVTLPAYPVWSTLVGKPTFGSAAYESVSAFTPASLPVTTKTGSSWTPDKNSAPSVMYQALTAGLTLNFQTADDDGVGCVHHIALANNTSAAKTVTLQRGSQGLAIACVSTSISVPANNTLFMTYIPINKNFYVIQSSILVIDHP